MSHLLGEAVVGEVSDSGRVLDVGTGSGVNARKMGTMSVVVATFGLPAPRSLGP
jgi:methylase of polypeptide subunit release factors